VFDFVSGVKASVVHLVTGIESQTNSDLRVFAS